MRLSYLTSSARKRAVSLIEGVLYLVIALAVIVGGIVFFQQAQLSNQVNDTARASISLSNAVRSLYQSQRTFGSGDITTALINSGSVPANFVGASGTEIKHPWGGNIYVAAVTAVSPATTNFMLIYQDIPKEACMRLFPASQGGDAAIGTGIVGGYMRDEFPQTGTTLGDVTAMAVAVTVDSSTIPFTPAQAATACDPGSGDGDVSVTIAYER